MRISFSPQRPVTPPRLPVIIKTGDILTVNGASFDFSNLPDGGEMSAEDVPCDWIVGSVRRVSGDLRVTLLLPVGPTPSAAVAFPDDLIDPPDGPIVMPTDEVA